MCAKTVVPQILLERFALGELSPEQTAEIQRRLAQDPALQEQLDQLQGSDKTILQAYPTHLMATQIRTRAEQADRFCRGPHAASSWPLSRVLAPAAAAAIILLVVLAVPRWDPDSLGGSTGAPTELAGVRLKGAPLFNVYLKEGNQAQRLEAGTRVEEGDRLQISYNGGDARHGVIFSVDGAGAVTLHFPQQPNGSTELGEPQRHTLPFAYELDAAPDFERFFFVTSADAIDVADVLQRAEALPAAPDARLDLPQGLTQRDLLLLKGKK